MSSEPLYGKEKSSDHLTIEEHETCIQRCLERWEIQDAAEDKRCQYFIDHFSEWISSLPDALRDEAWEHMNIFEYFSRQRINDSLSELYSALQEEGLIDYDYTAYSYIRRKDGTANSSFVLLEEFRRINGISKKCLIVDESVFLNDKSFSNVKTIVFVDDFCGSGNTFIKSVFQKYDKLLSGKTIIYVVIFCMKKGKEKLLEYASNHGYELKITSLYDKDVFYEEDEALKKDIIRKCSSDLGLNKNFALGYKETQALVAFQDNTPNNTFGYIWSNSADSDYSPIFKRNNDKTPAWITINKEKEDRKKENYRLNSH